MHPFLPTVTLLLLAMADAVTYFLWKQGAQPDVSLHRNAILAVIGISVLFGGGLAFWLRRYRIRFPFYFALLSAALMALIWVRARF